MGDEQPELLHSLQASFGGIPCAQYFIDFILWEKVLNDNPQLEGIVEIGTWQGGFSWFLWAQCKVRGMKFHTFDVLTPDRPPPKFIRKDVWEDPSSLELLFHQIEPLALFCDGGNKPRELATFPPMCAPGSIFLVHDWKTEMMPSDVPDDLVEVYGGFCDAIGSITRVFKHGS